MQNSSINWKVGREFSAELAAVDLHANLKKLIETIISTKEITPYLRPEIKFVVHNTSGNLTVSETFSFQEVLSGKLFLPTMIEKIDVLEKRDLNGALIVKVFLYPYGLRTTKVLLSKRIKLPVLEVVKKGVVNLVVKKSSKKNSTKADEAIAQTHDAIVKTAPSPQAAPPDLIKPGEVLEEVVSDDEIDSTKSDRVGAEIAAIHNLVVDEEVTNGFLKKDPYLVPATLLIPPAIASKSKANKKVGAKVPSIKVIMEGLKEEKPLNSILSKPRKIALDDPIEFSGQAWGTYPTDVSLRRIRIALYRNGLYTPNKILRSLNNDNPSRDEWAQFLIGLNVDAVNTSEVIRVEESILMIKWLRRHGLLPEVFKA